MSIPAVVLDAYGFSGLHIEPVSGGLINATYAVNGGDGLPVAAVQRLHPIFGREVNEDIDVVTRHLSDQGVTTPLLLRTTQGASWFDHEGDVWRAITWVPGTCYAKIPHVGLAQSGGQLVGEFHRALAGLAYDFRSTRTGVHDTAAHLQKLRLAMSTDRDPLLDSASALRDELLAQVQEMPTMPDLPSRICHGDLKISNLLFDGNDEGLCLIDLDTLGPQSIAFELGDALRSWANPAGEDTERPEIDDAIVKATALGYARGSDGLLSRVEIESVIVGLETVCFELAARFCVDAFEDSYFGWNQQRYQSRREHNLLRARGQLSLGQSVARQRESLQELWCGSF